MHFFALYGGLGAKRSSNIFCEDEINLPAIQFGNNGNNGNDSKFGNNAKEQPWIAKLCTENAPIDQNIRRAISCLGPPSIKATPHTFLTNNNLPFPPILTFWPMWPVWLCVPCVAMCYLVPSSLGPHNHISGRI